MGVLFRSRRNRGKRRNIIPKLLYSLDKKMKIMKINWNKLIRDVIIAVLSALGGGLGTYACM